MPILHFLSVTRKKTEAKRKTAKSSCVPSVASGKAERWLRGRMSDFPKHSMNSLRSNSISYFVTCTAKALQDSIMLQKILHPLKTSSCGMFLNNIMANPEGAKAREPYQYLDGGRSLPGVN